jgi:hypothetical protein
MKTPWLDRVLYTLLVVSFVLALVFWFGRYRFLPGNLP